MARPSTFPLYDRALQGQLAGLLRTWRAEGVSLSEIAFRLRVDHDIKVSASTVRRWLTDMEQAA